MLQHTSAVEVDFLQLPSAGPEEVAELSINEVVVPQSWPPTQCQRFGIGTSPKDRVQATGTEHAHVEDQVDWVRVPDDSIVWWRLPFFEEAAICQIAQP